MAHHSPWSVEKQSINSRQMIDPKELEKREWNTESESEYTESELDDAFAFNGHEIEAFGSGIEGYAEYELLSSDESTNDEGSSLSSNDEDEVEGIVVLDEREIDAAAGKKSQFLVKCWIDKKHFELFTELMRMS